MERKIDNIQIVDMESGDVIHTMDFKPSEPWVEHPNKLLARPRLTLTIEIPEEASMKKKIIIANLIRYAAIDDIASGTHVVNVKLSDKESNKLREALEKWVEESDDKAGYM